MHGPSCPVVDDLLHDLSTPHPAHHPHQHSARIGVSKWGQALWHGRGKPPLQTHRDPSVGSSVHTVYSALIWTCPMARAVTGMHAVHTLFCSPVPLCCVAHIYDSSQLRNTRGTVHRRSQGKVLCSIFVMPEITGINCILGNTSNELRQTSVPSHPKVSFSFLDRVIPMLSLQLNCEQ